MNTLSHTITSCTTQATTTEPHTSLLGRFAALFARLRTVGQRRSPLNMGTLDDRMLADIGVTRHQFAPAAKLPFQINEPASLRFMAGEQRVREQRMRRR